MPDDPHSGNGVPNYGDMTEFERWPDHAIDILVGGTPCQDYSVAGLRAGMAGDRGSLTLTFIQIAARYRPKWFVWENVPGVLSSNSGRDFARFLGDITGTKVSVPDGGWKNSGIVAGIPDAYGVVYVVRDAQFVRVDGFGRAVPQRRRRVFVVGYLGNWRRAAAVLLEPESLQGHSEPSRTAGKDVAGTIDAGFGRRRGSGMNPNQLTGQSISTQDAAQGHIIPDVAPTMDASMDAKFGSNQWVDSGQYVLEPIAWSEELAASLNVAGTIQRGGDGGRRDGVFAKNIVRRLTPIECERLQGFPDDFTRIPWRKKSESDCPDGPRYKALGNSMAVNVMRWIGQRIQMIEDLCAEVVS